MALVVASCLEIVHLDLLGVTIRPVHLVALGWVAYRILRSRGGLRSHDPIYRVALGSAGIIGLLSVPPLVAHHDMARVLLPSLVLVNMCLLVVAFDVFRSAGDLAPAALSTSLAIIIIVPLVQGVLAATGLISTFANREFSPIGRPPGLFEEGTWMAIVAGYAAVWGLGRRNVGLVLVALIVSLLAASRTALLALAAAISTLVPPPAHGRQVARLAVGGLFAFSLLLTPLSLGLLSPRSTTSSLDTRVMDQRLILDSMSDSAWLFGGNDLRLHDAIRDRDLPATSNNAYVDFFWKQGVFGLAVALVVMLLLIVALPQSVGLPWQPWRHPPPQVFIGLVVAMASANNALLRPWLWVFEGVTLAFFAYGATTSARVEDTAEGREDVAALMIRSAKRLRRRGPT